MDSTINVSNQQFLYAIFGSMYVYSHVTSFPEDPGNIPNDRRGICWAGGYYKDYPLQPGSNQFYTVSIFAADDNGKSKRRKVNFSGCYVIGADDVKEKLPLEQVNRLPPPSIILKSSNHSEQWLWILDEPETNRDRLDNLMDQLIANGLAPDGTDPGMKGVTRYLRLPEGFNLKAKRIEENGGTAPKCQITGWNPERRYKMEDLAIPFGVDLDAPRKESRVDGAAEFLNHPILQHIEVKSVLSAGRLDVTCPWVDTHTGAEDNGSAVFTNEDGSIGFACHHGHCQDKTANDLLKWVDTKQPGFKQQFESWQKLNVFGDVPMQATTPPMPDFLGESVGEQKKLPDAVQPLVDYQQLIDNMRLSHPGTPEQRQQAELILHSIDAMDYGEKLYWSDEVRGVMNWTKADLIKVIKSHRKKWYQEELKSKKFFENCVFVSSLNQFYDKHKRIFMTPEAFQNTYCHQDEEARKTALQSDEAVKVDMLDYAPGEDEIFIYQGRTYANTWRDTVQRGEPGDISPWQNHWGIMGWEEHRPMMEWWIAMNIMRPGTKINFAPGLCGGEGVGKDYLLEPLRRALQEHSKTIDGEEVFSSFNEYLMNIKHLHINEIEVGDHSETKRISNKLKPMIAAPPHTLNVNVKGVRGFVVRNKLNISFASNSSHPVHIDVGGRRYYMMWTPLNCRGEDGQMTEQWLAYWKEKWDWMDNGGWKYCVHYLMNNVDLDKFDPGAAPRVTDFTKDIQDMSKNPVVGVLEEVIGNRIGLMSSDIVSMKEVSETVRVYSNGQFNRVHNIAFGRALSEMGLRTSRFIRVNGIKMRVVIIRNEARYNEMQGSELADAYIELIRIARANAEIQLVDDKFGTTEKANPKKSFL